MSSSKTKLLSLEYGPLKRQDYPSELTVRKLSENLRRKQENGGVIFGYHGTSATEGRVIETNGFSHYSCAEIYTVWFWEEQWKDNAIIDGEKKAIGRGDTKYTIIYARLKDPIPDLSPQALPKWVSTREKIQFKGIEYVLIGQKPHYRFEDYTNI